MQDRRSARPRGFGFAAAWVWLIALGLLLGCPASAIADADADSLLYDAYITRIEQDSSDVDAFLGLARLFIKYDYFDDAALACLYARDLYPDDTALHVKTYLLLSRGHGEKGYLREAVQHYAAALELRPDDAALFAELGGLYEEYGQYADALEAYAEAAGRQSNVRYHTAMGRMYAAQDLYFEAVGELRYALVLDSTYAEAHHALGVAFYEREFVDKAIGAFEEAIRLKPGLPEARHALGLAYEDRGFYDKAIAQQKLALKRLAHWPEVHNDLGNAYLRKAMLRQNQRREVDAESLLNQAIKKYKDALALDPEFAEVHHNLGLTHSRGGRYTKAVKAYQRYLELNPGAKDYQQVKDRIVELTEKRTAGPDGAPKR